MAARMPGETKRPSVETLMHGLFPQAYVVHTHPAAVNGLTCGREGRAAFERLFADDGIWVPFVDPGYVLAKTVRAALEEFRPRIGKAPSIMLMQNHGLLVAGESPAEVVGLSERAMAAVLGEVKRRPDMAARAVDAGSWPTPRRRSRGSRRCLALAPRRASALSFASGPMGRASSGPPASRPTRPSPRPSPPITSSTPDTNSSLRNGVEGIGGAWSDLVARNGQAPRIIVVQGLGAFSCAATAAAADSAILLYADACKVAAYAESFGGALHMTKEKIEFIRNWEVEKYRSSVSTGE